MLSYRQSLGKNISQLEFGWDISGCNGTTIDLVSYKMAMNLDMFGSFMMNRVHCNGHGCLVVTFESDFLYEFEPQVFE